MNKLCTVQLFFMHCHNECIYMALPYEFHVGKSVFHASNLRSVSEQVLPNLNSVDHIGHFFSKSDMMIFTI